MSEYIDFNYNNLSKNKIYRNYDLLNYIKFTKKIKKVL